MKFCLARPTLFLLSGFLLFAGCGGGAADESGTTATGGTSSGGISSGGTATGGTGAAGAGGTSVGGTGGGSGGAVVTGTLAAKYADYFPIGAAVSAWHLDNVPEIVETQFNHLTAENAMKIQDIHPAEATFNWTAADRIADLAREKGMKLTGHTLLWHRQAPAWMFAGVTAEDPTSLETLKARLKAHIEAMVERYGDVVDNWDVVNEAISDSADKTYRDGGENSKWYELFGSEEYIYWAFQYAKDALEAREPGSSAGKLYYNEYTVTTKVEKILTMLDWLKNEKGIQIDGVGFQGHENLTWPSTVDLQGAIDQFAAAGYKVKISELDITVYSDYSTGAFVASPEVELTPALETQQAARYKSLFELYRANKEHITSVTFWGVSDDNTWLDNEPVSGRNDYPLLWDDAHQPKDAWTAIMDF
jgi:endo-1,4-beta-xylanase